ncbi:MAG: site-2 protease family protein [Bacilli bacterium]|jgi:regulator of sigma E protease
MNIWTFLLFIVSLGVLILIHELGHFTMAKLFHVYVKEFSLGFGPIIFKRKKGETQYTIRALPLGGYVAMYGEETAEVDQTIPKERSLLGVKKYKRALIMSAGIILNFILAFVLFFVSNIAFEQKEFRRNVNVAPGSPAAVAGLVSSSEATPVKIDFELIEEGNIPVTIPDAAEPHYVKYVGFSSYEDEFVDGIVFAYIEGGQTIVYKPDALSDTATFALPIQTYTSATEYVASTVTITLHAVASGDAFVWEDTGINLLHTYWYTFGEALAASGEEWVEGNTLIAKAIGGLFVGKGLEEVGGIIAIFDTSATVFQSLGLGPYIYMWGLISVNLALFNLLPFPGLDGWHLLVITVEGITRREIPSKIKNVVSTIGLLLLLGLMILLVIKDIWTLF